jgi:hypothetical protein
MINDYITKEVLPHVKNKAHNLALELQSLVAYLIPKRLDVDHTYIGLTERSQSPAATTNQTQTADPSDPVSTPTRMPPAYKTFFDNLCKIFERALMWRVNCQKVGVDRYSFRFYGYQERCSLDSLGVSGPDLAREVVVLMSIMPSIHLRTKPYIYAEREEPLLIWPASIFVGDWAECQTVVGQDEHQVAHDEQYEK